MKLSEGHNILNQSSKNTLQSLYTTTLIVYVLQALAMFTALPLVIAVIINYIKLDEARETWLHSHFRWQIRTFWFGLLFYIVAIILHVILIGFILGFIVWLWQIYRIARGWIRLSKQCEMYT